jgi:hypothetical protein
MFKWLTKKSSLNIIVGFRRELVKRYGQRPTFTSDQVILLCKENKVPRRYTFLTVALYCTEDDYTTFFENNAVVPNYADERRKVMTDIMKRSEPIVVSHKPKAQSSAHSPQSNESAVASYGLGAD